VQIDIIPPQINPYSRGVIPVVLFGDEHFDVSQINGSHWWLGTHFPSSGNYALPKHDLTDEWTLKEHLQDKNLDGYLDLMLHFDTQDTGTTCDDNYLLIFNALSGPFLGRDSITTVGCRSSSGPRPLLRERERLVRTDGRVIEPKLEDSDAQE
jgi:hypothetical protein